MSVEKTIREKLTKAFQPSELSVENESDKHRGHAGAHDDKGLVSGETHFRLRIVSNAFEGKSPVERHRAIHEVLKEELFGPVHALVIKSLTPSETAR